jgi:hypothetical protein
MNKLQAQIPEQQTKIPAKKSLCLVFNIKERKIEKIAYTNCCFRTGLLPILKKESASQVIKKSQQAAHVEQT